MPLVGGTHLPTSPWPATLFILRGLWAPGLLALKPGSRSFTGGLYFRAVSTFSSTAHVSGGENCAGVPTPRQESGCSTEGGLGQWVLTAAAPGFCPGVRGSGGTLPCLSLSSRGLRRLPQCRAARGTDG